MEGAGLKGHLGNVGMAVVFDNGGKGDDDFCQWLSVGTYSNVMLQWASTLLFFGVSSNWLSAAPCLQLHRKVMIVKD